MRVGPWGSGPPPPPKKKKRNYDNLFFFKSFVKRGTMVQVYTRIQCVLVVNSYSHPLPPPFQNPVSAQQYVVYTEAATQAML